MSQPLPTMSAACLFRAAAAMLPIDVATLTENAPVLVVAPHPDDESLGCGGLIAACVAAGIPLEVALLTDGAGSHPGSRTHPPPLLAQLRRRELVAALGELGLGEDVLHELGWPDRSVPVAGSDFGRAVAQIVALIHIVGARSVVAAWGHDPHGDHVAGAAIVAAAARAAGIRHLAYPVWGWTLPDDTQVTRSAPLRLAIASQLAAKRRAVACHRSQHGLVVTDSPGAFVLPRALLDACLTDHEVFFEQGCA